MANVGIGLIGCGGMGRHVARLLQNHDPRLEIRRSATRILDRSRPACATSTRLRVWSRTIVTSRERLTLIG